MLFRFKMITVSSHCLLLGLLVYSYKDYKDIK